MGSSDPDNHRRNIIFATALICAFYQMLHAFLGIIGLHNFPQFLIIQVLCEAIGAKQEEIADLHLFGKDVHLNVSLLTQAVNPKIKLVESVQLFWWFGLFHVPIQCGASNPKGSTDFWDGMTLVSK